VVSEEVIAQTALTRSEDSLVLAHLDDPIDEEE
jgi:hypothetical protein